MLIDEINFKIGQTRSERRARMEAEVLDIVNVDAITMGFDDVKVETSDLQISFKRKKEGYSWDQEMFYIYMDEDYRSEEDRYKSLRIGYYSTSSFDQWENERLVMLGRLAYVFLHHKDQMLERINAVMGEFAPTLSELYKELWKLEAIQREVDEKLRKEKLAGFHDRLRNDGLTYDRMTVDFLKRFDRYHNVVHAKVIPTAGKTVNVELTVTHWDNSTYLVVVERVKVDNLIGLIHNSLEWAAEK
jgi:hypothetical protein